MPPEDQTTTPAAEPSSLDSAMETLEEGLGIEADEPATPAEPGESEAPAGATGATGPAPTPSTQVPPAGATGPAAPAAPELPKSWTPEVAAAVAALPEPVRQFLAQREAQMTEQVTQARDATDVAAGIGKIFGPYQQVFQDFKVNPFDHVAMLLNTHAVLSFGTPEQKAEIVRNLIAQTGLDPLKLADPNARAYDPQQQALMARLTGLERTFGNVTTAMQERQIAELSVEIEKFAADPKNLYFNDLLPDMISSMQRNPNQTLKDCYEACIMLNPVTKAKEVERLATQRAGELSAEAAGRSRAARKATSVNVTSNQTRSRAQEPEGGEVDLDSFLKESLAEIRARDN